MTPQQLFPTEIEQNSFCERTLVASSYDAFLRILVNQPEMLELQSEVNSPEAVAALWARMRELVDEEINSDYQNPFDVALASYAIALSSVRPNQRRQVGMLLKTAPNLWWGQRLADHLILAERSDSARETIAAMPALRQAAQTQDVIAKASKFLEDATYLLHSPAVDYPPVQDAREADGKDEVVEAQ